MLKLRISGANLDADVDAAARVALDAAAARLAAEVRRTLATPPGGPHETPWRQTGALQASITHATEADTAVVGSASSYASAQERGTRHVPPRPFLLPTAQRLAPDLASSIGQAVAAAIDGSPVTAAAISHGGDAPDPDGIIRTHAGPPEPNAD